MFSAQSLFGRDDVLIFIKTIKNPMYVFFFIRVD